MQKFEVCKSVVAYIELLNIDTDMIIPKQFLKTIVKTGLGKNLFHEMRYDNQGNEKKDFILNKDGYRNAQILVALDNFGCGSSREHAPWSLLDYGIRTIIAPSFADIFYNNCFKNGILPIVLDRDKVLAIIQSCKEEHQFELEVNLLKKLIRFPDGSSITFSIDPVRRNNLLEGLDEIGITLKSLDAVRDFESKYQEQLPWLYVS